MKNPLLEELYQEEVIHTTDLALPTLGRFYEKGVIHPDADVANIEISPVGLVEEMRLNDPFVLVSGKATPKLIHAVAPAILQPEKLCSIDINAVLLAARIISHGAIMRIDVRCQNPKMVKGKPVCENEDKLDVDLTDLIMRYGPIEDEQMASYIVDLPVTEQKVCIQPPTYGHSIQALKNVVMAHKTFTSFQGHQTSELVDDPELAGQYEELIDMTARTSMEALVDQIFYVESRKGERYADKEIIADWVGSIPRDDVKEIQKRLKEMSEVLMKMNEISHKCSNCGHVSETLVSLDPQQLFFYTSETSSPKKKSSNSSKKKTNAERRRSRTSQR